MKQDILVPEVQDVIVAVVPRPVEATSAGEADLWDIYVINQREDSMDNVLITSQGYGSIDGRDKTTTVLRHFHQTVGAGEAVKVEPIEAELFGLKNEYWISFNSGNQMLDKKFVFKPGTISSESLETVPVLERPGVMIR